MIFPTKPENCGFLFLYTTKYREPLDALPEAPCFHFLLFSSSIFKEGLDFLFQTSPRGAEKNQRNQSGRKKRRPNHAEDIGEFVSQKLMHEKDMDGKTTRRNQPSGAVSRICPAGR